MSKQVYSAIAAVAAELAQVGIAKDRKAAAGKSNYNFRGIDDVYGALAPLLAKHKLVILPRFRDRTVVERKTGAGNAIFYTVVVGDFDFVSAEDGSAHTITTIGEAMDTSDKSTNKAMSTAYKYAAFQAFCIPVEGQSLDSERDSHDVASGVPDSEVAEWAKAVNKAAASEELQASWKKIAARCREVDDMDAYNHIKDRVMARLGELRKPEPDEKEAA